MLTVTKTSLYISSNNPVNEIHRSLSNMLQNVVFSVCVIIIAIMMYLVYCQYHSHDFQSGTSRQEISDLDTTIKIVKFSLRDVVDPFERIVTKNGNIYETIKRFSDNRSPTLTLQSVMKKRVPSIVVHSLLTEWPALRWDLWKLASQSKWPILSGVLALDQRPRDDNESTFNSRVFVVHNERDTGGMLTIASAVLPPRPAPRVVPEMYFADLLVDLKNLSSAHGESKTRYFYSANYRVMESIAKVCTC